MNPYTLKDLDKEIGEHVALIQGSNGGSVDKHFLIQSVLNEHSLPDDVEDGFWICTARELVSLRVNRHWQRLKASETVPDAQLIFPGYERLQRQYLTERDGRSVAVRVEDMTSEELEKKAAELESMSEGLIQHAEEIRRYLRQRDMGEADEEVGSEHQAPETR